jgi:hypothetical protein
MAHFIKKASNKKWGVLLLAASSYGFELRLMYNGEVLSSRFPDRKNREALEKRFDEILSQLDRNVSSIDSQPAAGEKIQR